ncbi:MAG TPA: hypothetical protein VEC36_09560 [Patescibacteria group bacterium]|nr:hypothetical protein [Patescibacteria group bacterium]
MDSEVRYYTPAEHSSKFLLQNTAKYITIWTIVTNLFIIVGIGHGILPLGLIEVMFILRIISQNLNLNSSEQYSILFLSIFSLLGQLHLFISLFFKDIKISLGIKWIGLIFMWVGFIIWPTIHFDFLFSWLFSIPFIICSIKLFLVLLRIPSAKSNI